MNVEELGKYGVPESVITKLKELDFSELTEVQRLAVEKGLFEGKNLVISAPTNTCLLYTSPSPRDGLLSRMPSSA